MRPLDPSNPGKTHADLLGAAVAHRFRPERLDATRLPEPLLCSFEYEGHHVGAMRVVDVSRTGLGLVPADIDIAPGGQLHDVSVEYQGTILWRGDASCAYLAAKPEPRMGILFTSDLFFDLALLQGQSSDIRHALANEIAQHRRMAASLPVAWIAGIALLRRLLERARAVLENAERDLEAQRVDEPAVRQRSLEALLEIAHKEWGPSYYETLRHLHALSLDLPEETREAARAFAAGELLELFYACPMHSRAHAKPRGYAGDYRLMTMYFNDVHQGGSLYGRFLHYGAQRHTLGRTVIERERFLRRSIREVVRTKHEPRVLSLACGPAIEIDRWLTESQKIPPVKLVLVDQDEEALEYSHQSLRRRLVVGRAAALPVDLTCVQLSVKQLLQPQGAAEEEIIGGVMQNTDLLYSAGLFDYLPERIAHRLAHRLYGLLSPGGRMLIGNLKEAADSTWLMEYVLSWHLEYRDEAAMLQMAQGLSPAPARVSVSHDATGYCMFLDVTRPAG